MTDTSVRSGLTWWANSVTNGALPVTSAAIGRRHTTIRARRFTPQSVRRIVVSRSDLAHLTDRAGGRWVISHAEAMFESRPPRWAMLRLLFAGTGLAAIAGFAIAAATSTSAARLLGLITGIVFAAFAAWLWRERRTTLVDRLLSADDVATAAHGFDAADEVLDVDAPFKTLAHHWWDTRNPISDINRYARLAARKR